MKNDGSLFAPERRSLPILVAIVTFMLVALTAAACGRSGADRSEGGEAAISAAAGSETQAAEAEAAALAAAEAAKAEAEAAEAEAAAPEASGLERADAERLAAVAVPAPVVSGPAEGVYAAAVTVSATVPLPEARLVYTLDGSAPSARNGTPYTKPLEIAKSATLRLAAYVPGGNTSRILSMEYTIGEVCAAPGGKGDGRRGAPLGSVSEAVAKARSLGIGIVKLAAGTSFTESVSLDAPIILSGGWAKGFAARTGGYAVVTGLESDSSSKKAPAYAIRVSGKAADAGVRIERVEFRGGAGSYSTGILVDAGATPAFSDCKASGGDGSYGYGAAVFGGAEPRFDSCTLSGGAGATSYGLSVDSAKARVAASFLLAGSGSVGGYGLSATDAVVRVAGSVLAGSPANVSYGAAFYTCADSGLEGCTVVGGSGKDSAGVFISASDPSIVNCIIGSYGSAKSYGILDNYGSSAPSRLESVAFTGCSGGIYYDADSKRAYTAVDGSGVPVSADGKAMQKPRASRIAIADIPLSPGDSYATPSDAPLPPATTLSGDAAKDIRGKPRTEPWTVGAYEL